MALVYRRSGNASVVDFKRRAQVLFGDTHLVTFNIPGGANEATVILPVSALPGSGQQTLTGLIDAMMTLTTFAQRQNAPLQLDPQPATQLINGEEVTLPWREVRFTLILPISPAVYRDSLPMPGLRIARIRTLREGVRLSYTLEGTLYSPSITLSDRCFAWRVFWRRRSMRTRHRPPRLRHKPPRYRFRWAH